MLAKVRLRRLCYARLGYVVIVDSKNTWWGRENTKTHEESQTARVTSALWFLICTRSSFVFVLYITNTSI